MPKHAVFCAASGSARAFFLSLFAVVPMALVSAASAAAGEAPQLQIVEQQQPPPPPGPLGVFGVDMPAQGRLVFSVSPQFSNFGGILKGTHYMTPEAVVLTTPWYFNPKLTLRGVPENTAVASQTVSLAYGVMKNLSIVVTAGMIERNLDFLTFKGASGAQRLGYSQTGADGLTDMTASAIYRIYEDPIHRFQMSLGLSFPTGSNHDTFTLLQATGVYQTSRAFYPMQPGSGTFDLMPGLVYAGHLDKWSWGLSYRGRFPLGDNPEGYRWGDLHEFNGWGGYTWTPGLTTTLRLTGTVQGSIRGFDVNIMGKAPASNPNNFGGQRAEVFGGLNISGKFIGWDNVSLAVEAGLPFYQDLYGPQIMKNWQAGMALRFKI